MDAVVGAFKSKKKKKKKKKYYFIKAIGSSCSKVCGKTSGDKDVQCTDNDYLVRSFRKQVIMRILGTFALRYTTSLYRRHIHLCEMAGIVMGANCLISLIYPPAAARATLMPQCTRGALLYRCTTAADDRPCGTRGRVSETEQTTY
jgi:hypothetical protein